MNLLKHHEKMLIGSGITPEVLEERGYRSIEKKAELEERGFSKPQRRVPALLIPIYGPTGEITAYQLRPDEPRADKKGRMIKYETPSGARMSLDVHPFDRGKLDDPSTPLFITEGVKKGDALISQGLCAVALLGVWNWRGTNERGGKTVLAEWDYVALNDREVYIVFDSDITLKPEVHAAMLRLKNFLEGR